MIYLFVSINSAKIFNVHARNEHSHVNAYGTMQRSVTHNIEMRYVLCANRNGQLLAKIKTIFPSGDHLSRFGNMSTVKLDVQFSKISLRRARAFIQYLFEAIFRAKSALRDVTVPQQERKRLVVN